MTLEQQQLCQRVQDEQGFVIIGGTAPDPIGFIIDTAMANFGSEPRNKLPPLRVIGYATEEEYLRQLARFFGQSREAHVTHFMKCVAE